MQYYKISILFLFIALTACGQTQKKETKPAAKGKGFSYAELSIRAGDDWKPEKFGGGAFKNVESLQLPEGHSDHAYYIRYEGPGWENQHIGYRLYLDWRNAIDIFGKKTDTMVLAYVGQNDYERYHHDSPWGQDILKAGSALGIGGYGRYMNDTVAHFRKVDKTICSVKNDSGSSTVTVDYTGWDTGNAKTNIKADLTIYPKDRYTKASFDISIPIEGFCTGIVKFKEIPLNQKKSANGAWGYIATYGNQTLVNNQDKLGMAIFYKTDEVAEIIDGPNDHLIVFKPGKKVTYYFLAAWEQELNGITTEEGFYKDLDKKLAELQKQGKLN